MMATGGVRRTGGMLTGSKPKAAADGVSKKMLIVIVAMLAIILLPAVISSMPLSKMVITITNADTEDRATCYLSVYGANLDNKEIVLMPGDEQVLSYSLKAGTYEVHVYYSFQDEQYYGRSFGTTVSMTMFETEHVDITLTK